MRLLDRYLLRELLIPLGYCLGGFLIFWITTDAFAELSKFQRYQLRTADIAEYYLVKTPEVLVTILPLALLLALLYALCNHARHHELTAIRAAGINLWRLALPYFLVAALLGAGLFALNEYAVPDGAEKAEAIMLRYDTGATNVQSHWQRSVVFNNQVEGRSWYIGAYHVPTYRMYRLHLEWRLQDGSRRQISAEHAYRTNGQWMLLDVEDVTIPAGMAVPPAPVRLESLLLPELSETPRLIVSEIKIGRLSSIKTARRTYLNVAEIREYLRLHPQIDAQRQDLLLTMLHSRASAPFTCLVVVLIALPFGAASGRRNVFVGVASSVFICFAFFVLRELFVAMGGGGRLAPWLAAWAPNVVFGLIGIIQTQRTR